MCSIKAKPDGFVNAGTDLTITAKVRPNQAPIASVTLLARVNYNPEQELPMAPKGDGTPGGVLLRF